MFGQRLRAARKARGLTLRELAARVGKQAPFLSQLENGKREPTLSLINALVRSLEIAPGDLLTSDPPSRRAELEVALARAQEDPAWSGELALPSFSPAATVPTVVLEIIERLVGELKRRGQVRAETPEGARKANAALRLEMRERDNYFPEIEAQAAQALSAIGYSSGGPLSRRMVADLALHFGFTIHPVPDLPRSLRSATDLRHRRIYVPERNQLGARAGRSLVVQTIGHFVLGHGEPGDFGEFLRERVEANYFAGACLVPEQAAVPFLRTAKEQRDVAVEDLEERFYVSYEMAAHRFTNLATEHLGIPVHFLRSDEEGVIWKAYENDGSPFPADADGAIEGQLLCRQWGPRRLFHSAQRFSIHYQYTDTPAGTYWDATRLQDREHEHAICVGTNLEASRLFRGSDTSERAVSKCPESGCCRRPSPELAVRWDGRAWPSPRPHSHVLAALPAGTFPGVNLAEVYQFLDSHGPR
jgi:predicted transcriptional regulator/DNA-binding XRE family transcriptional regulator